MESNEKEKNNMYKEKSKANEWDFAPFVVGTFGGLGPSAARVFRNVVTASATLEISCFYHHSWSAASYGPHWLQRISLQLHAANYHMQRAVFSRVGWLLPRQDDD
jgi:hypothetical protein